MIGKFGQPTVVQAYNKGMGGTDGFDQCLSYYRPRVKTVSWLPRVFIHFLNAASVNAFILCNTSCHAEGRYRYLDYVRLLIEQLVEEECAKKRQTGAATCGVRKATTWNKDVVRRSTGLHTPLIIQNTCREGNVNRNLVRSTCMVCKNKVIVKCKQCGVYLCIVDNGEIPCWERFHSPNNF